jgi:hypothetical protein
MRNSGLVNSADVQIRIGLLLIDNLEKQVGEVSAFDVLDAQQHDPFRAK